MSATATDPICETRSGRVKRRRAEVPERRAQGQTYQEIADVLGVSKTTIYNDLVALGLPTRPRRPAPTCVRCGGPVARRGVKRCAACAPHGKASTYSRGCRCDACRAGNAERARRWHARILEEITDA